MQQTHNTLPVPSSIRRFRLAGAVIGLTFVMLIALSYVPIATAVTGQGLVLAADDGCTPENPRQADNCPGLPPQKITSTCPKGQCIINKYIQPAINLASGMVGIVVAISIISAGIRYSTSADNPQKVSEAKQRLVTSIFVLIGFFTFYAFLNYLVPGGLV